MADRLNTTNYNDTINNTQNNTVISATILNQWRQNLKTVTDDHADEIEALQEYGGNRIINGNFSINQRGVSGTVTLSANQYGHDRWKGGASGCTYTFSTVNNVTTITITAGTLVQTIEGLNLFTGTHILTWSGTAQGRIGSGSYGATGVTGSITGGTNTSVEFGTGTLSQVQLCAGDVALPFQPRSYAEELRLCQRYFEKSYDDLTPPLSNTFYGSEYVQSVTGYLLAKQDIRFKVPKRTGPFISYYSSQNGTLGNSSEINVGGSFVADRAIVTSFASQTGFVVQSSSGNFTVGNFQRFHWTADAEL